MPSIKFIFGIGVDFVILHIVVAIDHLLVLVYFMGNGIVDFSQIQCLLCLFVES